MRSRKDEEELDEEDHAEAQSEGIKERRTLLAVRTRLPPIYQRGETYHFIHSPLHAHLQT